MPAWALCGEHHPRTHPCLLTPCVAGQTVVGYECDGCEFVLGADGRPVPTHSDGTPDNFEIIGSCPARWAPVFRTIVAGFWAAQKIQQGSCGQGDSWWYDEWDKDRLGAATMGVYVSPGGGTVFTAASTDWAHGLAGPERDA